jgi:hypothetical protein
MPIYGSRDVRSDDVGTHDVTACIDRDAYGEVRDAFYESSREGSKETEIVRRFRIPGDEGAEIRGRRAGRRSTREYHERLSLLSCDYSSIPVSRCHLPAR